ncbi:MAG: nucleotidyltransferase family protein [Gammaproteobacteria bacterium]|nr:nucleotidyltransferase family protein [Gammaproteobacteria bacterium]
MTSPIGVLLAAGSGERFGSHKLLHPLPDGRLLGIAAAENLIAVIPDSIAVVRPGDESVLKNALLELGYQLIVNADAESGMGGSLALGIRATRYRERGWVVALADMPWIDHASIRKVANRVEQGASLAAPEYRGQRGHPVGFSAIWGEQLAALSGDAGARCVLDSNRRELELLTVADPGVLQDVDRPEQLLRSTRWRTS